MNYVNYEKSIIRKYHVKLVGWPENIKFANPANLTSVEELRQLQQALRTHVCHWIKLTDREVRQYAETIEQREASGEQVGHKRKQRSDKGKPRKRVACLDEEDDQSSGLLSDAQAPGSSHTRTQRKRVAHPDEDDDQSCSPSDPRAPGPSNIQTHYKTRHSNSRRIFKSKAFIDSDVESEDTN